MNRIITLLLLVIITASISCSKYEEAPVTGPMPVTTMIKTGDFMINTFYENGINLSNQMGLVFFKFTQDGKLVASKEGIDYTGTWSEIKTGTTNTFTINVVTTDTKLQKANNTWRVTSISEYFLDLANGTMTMNLMKH